MFCSFRNSAYLCSVQEMVVIYFAGQAVKLLNPKLGIFYACTLRYWRLPICVKYLLFGVDHFLNSANGDRFLCIKFAYMS